jgi:hypothetical protein
VLFNPHRLANNFTLIESKTGKAKSIRLMAMFNDGVAIEKISMVLNHSNTTSTLRYLGITREEIMKTYDDYQL